MNFLNSYIVFSIFVMIILGCSFSLCIPPAATFVGTIGIWFCVGITKVWNQDGSEWIGGSCGFFIFFFACICMMRFCCFFFFLWMSAYLFLIFTEFLFGKNSIIVVHFFPNSFTFSSRSLSSCSVHGDGFCWLR